MHLCYQPQLISPTDPMARGHSSGITVSSSSFPGHSLEPTAPAWIFITASLKWHVALSTPSEPSSNSHAGLTTQPLALHPLQAPTDLSTQCKASRDPTALLIVVTNITCPLVTDTDGKIPSSSCVSWLLQLLTKEEKQDSCSVIAH